jgi:hypothetical protein
VILIIFQNTEKPSHVTCSPSSIGQSTYDPPTKPQPCSMHRTTRTRPHLDSVSLFYPLNQCNASVILYCFPCIKNSNKSRRYIRDSVAIEGARHVLWSDSCAAANACDVAGAIDPQAVTLRHVNSRGRDVAALRAEWQRAVQSQSAHCFYKQLTCPFQGPRCNGIKGPGD